MQKIWFSEHLSEYRWVLHIDESYEHYSGTATCMEQALRDIEICKDYHKSKLPPQAK